MTMIGDLNDKVAVVTGGARGIGKAIALRLAQAGADIVIGDIDLSGSIAVGSAVSNTTALAAVEALGRRAYGVAGDLTQRAAADALIGLAMEKLGHVDILINNAGGFVAPAPGSWPASMSEEDLDFMLATNFKSAFFCCQAVVASMRVRKSGSIINVASGLGLEPTARGGLGAHYGLAKAAIIHYTRTLAAEVGPDGVRVNAVSPGMIATPRVLAASAERKIGTDEDVLKVALRRRGAPEEIATAVAFFASEDSSYITGQCLSVCGGRIMTPS